MIFNVVEAIDVSEAAEAIRLHRIEDTKRFF